MNYFKGCQLIMNFKGLQLMIILIAIAILILAGCIQAEKDFSGQNETGNKAVGQKDLLSEETTKNVGTIKTEIEIPENGSVEPSKEMTVTDSKEKPGIEEPRTTAPLSQPLAVDSPKGQHNEESSFYAKGLRGYEGKILKVVIGKGYEDSEGNYVINLKLYDDKSNLIDSREFKTRDTQSKFVNREGDRIVATPFVVTEILKRVENGVDKYYAKIV